MKPMSAPGIWRIWGMCSPSHSSHPSNAPRESAGSRKSGPAKGEDEGCTCEGDTIHDVTSQKNDWSYYTPRRRKLQPQICRAEVFSSSRLAKQRPIGYTVNKEVYLDEYAGKRQIDSRTQEQGVDRYGDHNFLLWIESGEEQYRPGGGDEK